jgi:hypothetical protein
MPGIRPLAGYRVCRRRGSHRLAERGGEHAGLVGASRLLATGLGRIAAAASLQPAQVNGYPALILRLNGQIDTVVAVRVDDGLVTGLYAMRNPEKLSHMERETALRR